MDDDDMTPEEFDSRLEAGTSTHLNVNVARTWASATTITLTWPDDFTD